MAPKVKIQQGTDPRTRMPRIVATGRRLAPHEDFYHWVLTLSWLQFFGMVAVAFAVINAIFATLYSLQPGCIASATGFADHFFFSVQTLGTIGYGSMAPATRYGNAIVSFEALVGILTTAVITGLTFVRFARPTARILFADKIVVAPRDGVPHVMFRLANWRRNQIVEAQLSVMVLVTERTQEGEMMRRPTELPLVRSSNPMFALTWTAMHAIDEDSLFRGPDAMKRLRDLNAEIFLSVTGYDETIAQTIHARFRYALDDVVWNARFADVLTTNEAGTRMIDFDKFHEVVPLEEMSEDGFLHSMKDVGEVRLHVVEARPAEFDAAKTPLVVLCHGFPEFSWTWRHQMRALAAAGLWAVAPDMRGYGESDKPKSVASYDVDRVAGDVVGLIRALGRDRASIVGHDWGGTVAYHFAAEHEAMLEKLVILNSPHLYVMLRHLRTRKQFAKSWYMFFFQLPGIAERAARKGDFAQMRRMFAIDGLGPEEIERLIEAIRIPGAITGGMSYYRAMMRRTLRFDVPRAKRIEKPVLVIWGDRDRHLGAELAAPPSKYVPNTRIVHVPQASHWIQNDAVEEVNALLVDFLGVR